MLIAVSIARADRIPTRTAVEFAGHPRDPCRRLAVVPLELFVVASAEADDLCCCLVTMSQFLVR